jgi:large conductance mechanosensitive channel
MLKEFRDFISKGNVLDLAVGIMIGAAFGAIVSSFVKDLLTPLLGIAGKANFENMFLVLHAGDKDPGPYASLDAATKAGANVLSYGVFLNALINFLIIAFVLFLIVRTVNKMRKQEAEAPAAAPEPTNEEKLLTEIRDLLKKN